MKIIETPYLPISKVKTVLISRDVSEEIKNSLTDLGIECIEVYGPNFLDERIRNHPDMNFAFCKGSDVFTFLNDSAFGNYADFFKIQKIAPENEKNILKYPEEAMLDVIFAQEHLFCGEKCVNNLLTKYASEHNITCIPLKQGYVKCSVAFVANDAVITEDENISKKFKELSYKVLLLETKSVKLRGYGCGFIGGACGKISERILAFTGCVENHPEYSRIKKFCAENFVEIISLSKNDLEDFGGIIPIIQN